MPDLRPGVDYIGIAVPFYCNDGSGRFLMHRRGEASRDEGGRWDFGSGKLEFGEDPEDTVLREAMEEYGVEGKIQEQIPAHSIIRGESGVRTHWLVIPFFVKVDIGKARIIEPHKMTEIGVFTLDKLPRPLHTGVQQTMSRYAEYFGRYGKVRDLQRSR